MKGYERMHPTARTLFLKVHTEHLLNMTKEERKKYELTHIKQLVQNNKERCVEVFYKNGERFKYYENLTWR